VHAGETDRVARSPAATRLNCSRPVSQPVAHLGRLRGLRGRASPADGGAERPKEVSITAAGALDQAAGALDQLLGWRLGAAAEALQPAAPGLGDRLGEPSPSAPLPTGRGVSGLGCLLRLPSPSGGRYFAQACGSVPQAPHACRSAQADRTRGPAGPEARAGHRRRHTRRPRESGGFQLQAPECNSLIQLLRHLFPAPSASSIVGAAGQRPHRVPVTVSRVADPGPRFRERRAEHPPATLLCGSPPPRWA